MATPSTEWRAWAFARAGVGYNARSDARALSIAAGMGASYGAIVGIARGAASASGPLFGDTPEPQVQDYALLAGLRTRDDRLFIAGAVGLARATDGESRVGRLEPLQRFVPTYDLSAHADYRVIGTVLTLSGTVGPADTRYVALTLGLELGWFGR